ncbi:MAG: galactonate dehydratase [Acidobacteria bacterium SCN 69-37]|nr:MAG: galactonate dehydratase [Acidobacteria bacterium SCN 69-37]
MDTATVLPTIRLHADDNVVVALRLLATGEAIGTDGIIADGRIPAGHKVAVRAIAEGEPIRRYGEIIGFAGRGIAPGEHVHTHNCVLHEFNRQYEFSTAVIPTAPITPQATFQGIVRPDGRVATRNYLAILSSVNCSATVSRHIADAFRRHPVTGDGLLADFPNVDGVVALTHRTGCGQAYVGEGIDVLRRTMGGYARHPNFAATFIIGLGCETNQVADIITTQRLKMAPTMRAFTIQEMGGARKTIERGIDQIRELLPDANRVVRQPVPASELILALQCGGSDGMSGITANPALGVASDLLVRHGGTVVLAETPETYGAEHLLTRRAVSREVGEKLLALFDWWRDYTARSGGEFDNNPSPGNKAGGITTIVEKSLGAMAKAGTTNLVDVVRYAEPVRAKGFVFMDTPGYDPVSATGQVAGGANLVCFTTGRGSVFGCVPAPSVKVATNTALARRMPEDMDLNAGGIVEGTDTIEACGQRIFDTLLRVASGEPTRSETQGFGESEFAPWQIGAVM